MKCKALIGLCFGFFVTLSVSAQPLPRSLPEAQGVSSSGILQFVDAISKSKNEFHSLMILRHGKVIAEGWWNPYRPDLRHTMYSVSKSFTSTAIGLAVSEGRIKMSDKVISFFKEDLPDTVSTSLSALTLKDLITMTVGQKPDPTFQTMQKDDWAKYFLSLPLVDTPGKFFLYNSISPYMLSAVIQKVTGQKMIDYLRPRLFEPLGIQGMDWETSPQGINTGGWGLRVKTEDLARMGQLYLQKGSWNGHQLLPAAWIEEATTFKIDQAPTMAKASRDSNDWAQGYCYQFWRCRHNSFRADGAFGQYIVVMPDQDAVVIMTSETSNMQSELNLVWDYLLPAFKNTPVQANATDAAALRSRLTSLSLPPLPATAHPAAAATIAGKTFEFEKNDQGFDAFRFDFPAGACNLQIRSGDSLYGFHFGSGQWLTGETRLPNTPPSLIKAVKGPYFDLGPSKTACSYTWRDDHTLELAIRYIESPHTEYYICQFDQNNGVSIELDGSVKRMAVRKNNKVLKGMANN